MFTLGFYVNDKKEGFGIYFWANPNSRAYIGFWKNGKQDGVGKYINQNSTRYGLWTNGERTKWYDTEKEALELLSKQQLSYTNLFKFSLEEVTEFLSK